MSDKEVKKQVIFVLTVGLLATVAVIMVSYIFSLFV